MNFEMLFKEWMELGDNFNEKNLGWKESYTDGHETQIYTDTSH